MTILLDDWLKFHESLQKIKAPPHLADRIQKTQQAEIARTVVEHPGWQFFLDGLDGILSACMQRLNAIKDQMALGMELGAELERLKLDVRTVSGQIAGIQMAKDLIPQAITQGTEAVMKLTAPSV